MQSPLKAKLVELFGADRRSLAFFRLGLGTLVLWDLASRGRDLVAHYTDDGVMPRLAVLENFKDAAHWSFHLASGAAAVQAIFFAVAAAFAVAFLLGYRTRLATFFLWLFTLSLQMRNPLVLESGDKLLHTLLFWSLFLPLGDRYSLDSRRSPGVLQPPTHVLSAATFAFFAQIVFVYFFTAMLKTGASWRSEGTAVYYALSMDHFVTPFGFFLLRFPDLLKFLTSTVLWFEWVGPFLLFTPVFTGHVRTFMVFVFWAFQTGLGLSLMLGIFPWVSAVAMIPFLPRGFWDRFLPPEGMSSRVDGKAGRLGKNLLNNILATLFLVYVFFSNVAGVNPACRIPAALQGLGRFLKLEQRWGMYAPSPRRNSGWFVIAGRLKSGEVIDVLKGGGAVGWGKPRLVITTYRNARWRKYLFSLWKRKYRAHRRYFAAYLCRDWNARHHGVERLDALEVFFMSKDALPDNRSTEPRKVRLLKQRCRED